MTPPLPSLYIHIPFCLSRCRYCAFTSGLYTPDLADAYLSALEKELKARKIQEQQLETLFIGGGTPSCLSTNQLQKLLEILPTPHGEATSEMNPDSTSKEKLRLLREWGINRISFGVQTFSPKGLKLLGRRHNPQTALQAIDWALTEEFPRGINIDLINGWPEQENDILIDDINKSINVGIQHISNYNFILEEAAAGFGLYSGMMHEDEERERRYWDFIEETLENNGFIHYETSNFSLPGFACRHNVAIWKGGEYFGVGLGAHSHMNGRRFANCTDLDIYIQCSSKPEMIEVFSERLEGKEKARECAVFWLRLFEGIDLGEFAEKTGWEFGDLYREELPGLLNSGVMEKTGGHVRVAKKYQPLLDMVLADLV